jgi:hypothetical protein
MVATHDEKQEILETIDIKARIDRVSRIFDRDYVNGGQISKGKCGAVPTRRSRTLLTRWTSSSSRAKHCRRSTIICSEL